MQKKLNLVLMVFLSILPSVFAQSDNIITDAFGKIYEVLQDEDLVFALTFLLFLILLYALFAAALGRTSVFGDNKLPNKLGRMIAITLSALICIGLFSLGGRENLIAFIGSQMALMGIPGALMFGVLIFAVAYASFKGKKGRSLAKALFVLGLTFIVWGLISLSEDIYSWGWIILLVSITMGLLKLFGRGGRQEPPPRGLGRQPPPERGPTQPTRPRRSWLGPAVRWVRSRVAPHLNNILHRGRRQGEIQTGITNRIEGNIEEELNLSKSNRKSLSELKELMTRSLSTNYIFNESQLNQIIQKLDSVSDRLKNYEMRLIRRRERLVALEKRNRFREKDTVQKLAELIESHLGLPPYSAGEERWKIIEAHAKNLINQVITNNKAMNETIRFIDYYDRRLKQIPQKIDVIKKHLKSTTKENLKTRLNWALGRINEVEKQYDGATAKLKAIHDRLWEIEKYSRKIDSDYQQVIDDLRKSFKL
jgi:hypothetical protein